MQEGFGKVWRFQLEKPLKCYELSSVGDSGWHSDQNVETNADRKGQAQAVSAGNRNAMGSRARACVYYALAQKVPAF